MNAHRLLRIGVTTFVLAVSSTIRAADGDGATVSGPTGTGTGFFITADGYLITNAHVVENCHKVQVKFGNQILNSVVVRTDRNNDIAMLKVEGSFNCLPILASRDVALGSTVATIGFPNTELMGFSPKLSKGEIAARAGDRDNPRFFQISVPVQPGNSGGALVDADGNVVGVVTAKLSAKAALASSGALPENVNYALKSSLLLSFLESFPEVSPSLKIPNKSGRAFKEVVKDLEESSAMVLAYSASDAGMRSSPITSARPSAPPTPLPRPSTPPTPLPLPDKPPSAKHVSSPHGDAAWQKANDVIEGIKNPKEKPNSRDEAIAALKKGLTEFDAAYAAAMKAAPTNPARWEAALFESMVGRAREIAGVPAPAKAAITLADILKAEDAKPETKSQASLIDVMESAETAEGPGGDTAAWMAKAEAHLKAFPEEKMNRIVEGKVKSIKAAVDLKTKPLELKFTAVDGKEVDVSKLQGKVVLIDFWATWCGPCVAELPNVIKAYKELHPKGFEIVGISLDSDKAELEAFVKEKGMEWPQYFDGKGWQNEISSKYGIESIPAMWLLNKKGMVVSTDARGGLEAAVAKLLAE